MVLFKRGERFVIPLQWMFRFRNPFVYLKRRGKTVLFRFFTHQIHIFDFPLDIYTFIVYNMIVGRLRDEDKRPD